MTLFDFYVLGAWTFVIGWFIGAIYVQNREESAESPDLAEKAEPCPDCDALRLPALPRAVGAD